MITVNTKKKKKINATETVDTEELRDTGLWDSFVNRLKGIKDFFSSIPDRVTTAIGNFGKWLGSTVSNAIFKIPFIKEISSLVIGIRLLAQPCAGLQGISFIIFTPIILGIIYLVVKLVLP